MAEILPHSRARFATGSIIGHISIMTLSGAIGMMALFLVDLTSLFFLTLLRQTAVTAAIGYAASIIFFSTSIGLGGSVAASVLVARSIGKNEVDRARDYATSAFLFSLLSSVLIAITLVSLSGSLLSLMKADGETRHLAQVYIWTVSPGLVLFGASLCLAAILRGLGDARRAMNVMLLMVTVTVVLNPILIFGLRLGIEGAAVAAVLGYLAAFTIGLNGVIRVHRFLNPLRLSGLRRDIADIWGITYPATLSQVTLPLGNAYMTYVISQFGDQAVAGFAIISRVTPVAFGIAIALSSAIGPVIGQNFGAGQYDRVRSALNQSLLVSTAYTIAMSLLLLVISEEIAATFNATGHAHDQIIFFCKYIAISWVFVSALFIANAAFNNLGYPRRSAIFSWARATVGTIPFVYIGAQWGGWRGLLIGNAIGGVLFGLAAVIVAYRVTTETALRNRTQPAPDSKCNTLPETVR
jgi:putative MATE family efflux protein